MEEKSDTGRVEMSPAYSISVAQGSGVFIQAAAKEEEEEGRGVPTMNNFLQTHIN